MASISEIRAQVIQLAADELKIDTSPAAQIASLRLQVVCNGQSGQEILNRAEGLRRKAVEQALLSVKKAKEASIQRQQEQINTVQAQANEYMGGNQLPLMEFLTDLEERKAAQQASQERLDQLNALSPTQLLETPLTDDKL